MEMPSVIEDDVLVLVLLERFVMLLLNAQMTK